MRGLKKKRPSEAGRRAFLRSAALMGGGAAAGAALMGIGQRALAGPSPTQVAVYNKNSLITTYDYLIFSDGTNYYAKSGIDGHTVFTNATPDICALLQSIDGAASAGTITKIYIFAGTYTGASTFAPGQNKGYYIQGAGGMSMQQPDLATTHLYTGTIFNFTPSTGPVVDCTAHWGSGYVYDAQQLIFIDLTFLAPNIGASVTDYIVKMTGTTGDGSRFTRCSFLGNDSQTTQPNSIGLYAGEQNQLFATVIESCNFACLNEGLVLNGDIQTVRDCVFNTCTHAGILVAGGREMIISGCYFYFCSNNDNTGGGIVDNRAAINEAPLVVFSCVSEASPGVIFSLNNAAVIIVGSFIQSSRGMAPVVSRGVFGSTLFSNPSDPSGTTSTTPVMMGLGSTLAFTPKTAPYFVGDAGGVKSSIVVTLYADVANSTINDGMTAQLAYGTGTAPVNGAAATGTTVGPLLTRLSAIAAEKQQVAFIVTITGLTPATAYWLDIQLAAVTGGTATMTKVQAKINEVGATDS